MKSKERTSTDVGSNTPLVRLGAVLEQLGIGYQTYQSMKKAGRWMPEIRVNQRVIFIEQADIEEWKEREKTHVTRGNQVAAKTNPDGWLDLRLYHTVFVEHIASDIKFCMQHKRIAAAAQLLMAAIDVAAGIERPREKPETDRNDFIEWADRYLCLKGPEHSLRGVDIYAARCGLLHAYTAQARLVRQGKAVMLGWVDDMLPPVRANEDNSLVMASLAALFVAFNHGLADSISRINRNEELALLVNERLGLMFQASQLDASTKSALRDAAAEWRAVQLTRARDDS